jgi:hypothetical protein
MSKKNKPKIILVLAGGLGNQMFQLAAALNISEGNRIQLETGVALPRRNHLGEAEIQSFALPDSTETRKLVFPNTLMRKNVNLFLRMSASEQHFHKWPGYRLLTLFSSLINSFYFREWRKTVATEALGDSNVLLPSCNVMLVGLFQSQKWVEDIQVKQTMQNLEISNPSDQLVELESDSVAEVPLIVHVRLGDYMQEETFGIPDYVYYKTAINRALSDSSYRTIWLFSNDLVAARQFLPDELSLPVREIGDVGLSSAEVLQAMRFGKGYVIGNSTFSWWGAFLSKDERARVYYPQPWFKATHSPENLTPKHWMPISAWNS